MGVVVYKGEGDTFERVVIDSYSVTSYLGIGYRLTKEVVENPSAVVVDDKTDEEKDPLAPRKRGRTKKS